MRLELYIADLLFRHDCVIVPHLGAFIGRTKSSEIGSATHLFRPPFKEVGFNSSLKENDGLLAGYLASLNGVSYNQAERWIASEVGHWIQRLNQGEKLHLSPIGKLYYNANGSLQFQPSLEQNFSSDSFGLGIFHVPSLSSTLKKVDVSTTEKLKHSSKKEAKIILQEPISTPNKFSSFSWKQAAIWLPIAGILSLGIANNSFISDAYKSYSSLGPIVFSKAQVHQTSESNLLPISGLEGMKTKSVVPFGGGVMSSSTIETKESEPEAKPRPISNQNTSDIHSVDLKPENSISQLSTGTSKSRIENFNSNTNDRFYIVVGSFGQESNSKKMIQALLSKGYNAKVAPGSGLIRVSIEDFATRNEADMALEQIRNSIQSSAWVYSPK